MRNLLGGLIISSTLLMAGNFNEGLKLFDSGKLKEAYTEFLTLANSGDVDAQTMLGEMYLDGIGVEQNNKKAFYWIYKAAHSSDKEAKYLLGFMYENGIEVDSRPMGSKCDCGGELSVTKGIEVGHIFKLGTTYSEALGATYLDRNGKSQPFIMGTYGMGISRLIAAIVEQHHDKKGIKWTKTTTPYDTLIIISDIKKSDQVEFANRLYEDLQSKGLNVAIDDRSERFGFKIGDFELIGIQKAVIVGKNLQKGIVEIVKRDDLIKVEVNSNDIVKKIMEP